MRKNRNRKETPRTSPRKLKHEKKPAGRGKHEEQKEDIRVAELRKKLEMARKELTRDLRNLREKEKKAEELQRRQEQEDRLQAQRKELDIAIALTRAEKSTNKAPPPPAPKHKAPPQNNKRENSSNRRRNRQAKISPPQ